MESQFGTALPFEETLIALHNLIEQFCHDRSTITPENLRRLEGFAQMLAYHTRPREGVGPLEYPLIADIRCHQCNKHWSVQDACLLFINNKWLCRDHHPKRKDGDVAFPGFTPPQSDLDKLNVERKAALAKISRKELALINTRI